MISNLKLLSGQDSGSPKWAPVPNPGAMQWKHWIEEGQEWGWVGRASPTQTCKWISQNQQVATVAQGLHEKSNTKSTATFFLVGMGEISRTSHRTRATPGRLLSKGNGGCSQSSFGSPSEMVVSTRSVVAAQTKRWTSPLTYQENNTHRSCTEVPVEAADIQLQNARLYSGTISWNCWSSALSKYSCGRNSKHMLEACRAQNRMDCQESARKTPLSLCLLGTFTAKSSDRCHASA